MDIKLLPLGKIMEIHADLAERYGLPAYGTNPDVRDMAALNRVVDRVAALSKNAGPNQLSVLAGEYLLLRSSSIRLWTPIAEPLRPAALLSRA